MKSMRKTVIAILATGIVGTGAFLLYAGSAGEVTIPTAVKVGTKNTGAATDGTDGYKPTSAKGLNHIKKEATVSGNKVTFKAGNKPSDEVGDSGVTVSYTNPSVPGEAEIPVTKNCTVVGFKGILSGSAVANGERAILRIKGEGLPEGLGGVRGIITNIKEGAYNPPPPIRLPASLSNKYDQKVTVVSELGSWVGVLVTAEVNYAKFVFTAEGTFSSHGGMGARFK